MYVSYQNAGDLNCHNTGSWVLKSDLYTVQPELKVVKRNAKYSDLQRFKQWWWLFNVQVTGILEKY